MKASDSNGTLNNDIKSNTTDLKFGHIKRMGSYFSD